VVPVSGTLPPLPFPLPLPFPFPFPFPSTELVVFEPLPDGDALESADRSSIDDLVVVMLVAAPTESNAVVSILDVDVEPGSVAEVVSAFVLTQSDRVAGAPSEGNSVSRTVNAAAVPPTAVQQYNIQPTNAFVRRRAPRRGVVASAPRSTLRIDTRSLTRRAGPLIIGWRPSPPPWPRSSQSCSPIPNSVE
jgi:hypothetical protein